VSTRIKFDIIGITETWHIDIRSAPHLDGFLIVSVVRSSKKVGEVSIYVTDALNFKTCESLTFVNASVESVAILTDKVLFVVIYRLPNGCPNSFYEHLCKVLDFATTKNVKICISGDFNMDFLKDDRNTLLIHDLMVSYGCFNVIQTGTRPTITGNPLLDPIFINFTNSTINSAVLSNCISDHQPTAVEIQISSSKRQSLKIHYIDFSDNNIQRFRRLMSNMNFDYIML